jgi:hypothetical protein
MWSRMPIPGSGYGHRCACDLTNDDHGDHPQVSHRRRHHHRDDDRMIEALLAASCCELRHLACLLACSLLSLECCFRFALQDFSCGCKMGEERGSCTTPGNCSSGACLPCPETPGSDCSVSALSVSLALKLWNLWNTYTHTHTHTPTHTTVLLGHTTSSAPLLLLALLMLRYDAHSLPCRPPARLASAVTTRRATRRTLGTPSSLPATLNAWPSGRG